MFKFQEKQLFSLVPLSSVALSSNNGEGRDAFELFSGISISGERYATLALAGAATK